MRRRTPSRVLRRETIAAAALLTLAAPGAHALDLMQAPPGTLSMAVRPNVILSIDDSGSMDSGLGGTDTSGKKRIDILKDSLNSVFGAGSTVVPDGRIRLAWQVMWNNPPSGGTASPGVGTVETYTFPGYNGIYKTSGGASSVDSPTNGINSMRVLDATHRKDFLQFVDKLTANSGTSTHAMMAKADHYLRLPLSKDGPWASDPGNTDASYTGAPYLGCRRNYHILFTDGRWNGGDNLWIPTRSQTDNAQNLTLPDGTAYAGADTRLYRSSDPRTKGDTVADWAFYSWATPLQTAGLEGVLKPPGDYRDAKAAAKQTQSFGNDRTDRAATLSSPYWNPQYDPATWPHLVTYTIGFSNDATTWPGAPGIQAPSSKVPFGLDGSFPDFVTGAATWPTMYAGFADKSNVGGGNGPVPENVRSLDLWHAALNGRGRFYAVTQAPQLKDAFTDILNQINAQSETAQGSASSAVSGNNSSRARVSQFVASYTYDPTKGWSGTVQPNPVGSCATTGTASAGCADPTTGWGGKTSADWLDALSDASVSSGGTARTILTYSTKPTSNGVLGGAPFFWTNLGTTQQDALRASGAPTTGAQPARDQPAIDRLDYIRGDHRKEARNNGGTLRNRTSRQGDIVNSAIWYTSAPANFYSYPGYLGFVKDQHTRTPMLYVGGNDGMLHGFSAADGSEKLAYVPQGVLPKLVAFTQPSFNTSHIYTVDGSPMTGDVDVSGSGAWHTLLVGSPGAGSRGYFVLDVTDPNGFNNASNVVTRDNTYSDQNVATTCPAGQTTDTMVCDLGFITARPVVDDANPTRASQITRLNNGRWAAVLGNGYNSANQRPVLLIQYLDTSGELLRIPATSGTAAPGAGNAKDNGLSAPRLVDLNGDGMADVAYAGDNLGNLWKFDLTGTSDADWKVAFHGSPLFTATGPLQAGAARNQVQPITAAPLVRANDRQMATGTGAAAQIGPVGGLMVAFGTGRDVAQTDPQNTAVQTIYSVLDNTRYTLVTPTAGGRAVLQAQTTCPRTPCGALGTGVAAAQLKPRAIQDSTVDSTTLGAISAATGNALDASGWTTSNGWYADLPQHSTSGSSERVLEPMTLYDGSNILAVWSQVPSSGTTTALESCQPTLNPGQQYLTLINIMDGLPPTVALLGVLTNDGFTLRSKEYSRLAIPSGAHSMVAQGALTQVVDGGGNTAAVLARMPDSVLRPSWRQLQ